ncbi:hypothetical protein LTR60_005842, partial [Cryomyces antarcticus]
MVFLRTLPVTALAALAAAAPGDPASSNDQTPMQLRLAYAGDTGVRVSWNTFAQLQNPAVRYGTNPQALNQIASSSVSITYPTSLTHNNHVTISGLEPDTLYYYQPANSNSSTPYTF